MENNSKFIIFKTTNKKNNFFYYGLHETETLRFDGYLGDNVWMDNPNSYNKGRTPLKNAILKYGLGSFYRETIGVFKEKQIAENFLNTLLTKESLSNPKCYNYSLLTSIKRIETPIYQFKEGKLIKVWDNEETLLENYNTNISFREVINSGRVFDKSLWNDTEQSPAPVLTDSNLINRYTLTGVLLNQFKSTSQAAQLLDTKEANISKAVFRKTPFMKFYFLYDSQDLEVINNKAKSQKRRIYEYDLDGNLVREFKSVVEAKRNTPCLTNKRIRNAIVNKITSCGSYWAEVKVNNFKELLNK